MSRYFDNKAKALNRRAKSFGDRCGYVSAAQLKTLFKYARGRCKECGSSESLTVDHVVPLARGGLNILQNLQVLCETCNQKKGTEVGSGLPIHEQKKIAERLTRFRG